MATSIFGRKRDLLYLLYFVVHLPVMFCEFAGFFPSEFRFAYSAPIDYFWVAFGIRSVADPADVLCFVSGRAGLCFAAVRL